MAKSISHIEKGLDDTNSSSQANSCSSLLDSLCAWLYGPGWFPGLATSFKIAWRKLQRGPVRTIPVTRVLVFGLCPPRKTPHSKIISFSLIFVCRFVGLFGIILFVFHSRFCTIWHCSLNIFFSDISFSRYCLLCRFKSPIVKYCLCWMLDLRHDSVGHTSLY